MSSTILDDETIAEIQRIVSMQEEDNENGELRLELNPKPLIRSASYLQQTPKRTGLFDSSASPPQYHPHRNERMTVFMSREHDSMDKVSSAIKKKKLEIAREHEERLKTNAPTRDRKGLFDGNAKIRTTTMTLTPSDDSPSSPTSSVSPRTPNSASPRSPYSPSDDLGVDTTSGGTSLNKQLRVSDASSDDLSSEMKLKLSGLKKGKKKTSSLTKALSPHSPNHPIDEQTSPRLALVNFFKNRKLQKMGDRIIDVPAPIITDKEKLELKQVRRRSSELGGMFLINSADKLEPAEGMPWNVASNKKTRHKKDPKKILNRVDIFSFTSIEEVLADPDAKQMLKDFAEDEFADENILFWDDLTKYQREGLLTHRIEMAKYLFDTYVDPKAPLALNINLKSVQECRLIYETGSEEAFAVIQIEVLQALCDLLERLRFAVQKERISEMDKFQSKNEEPKRVSASYQEFHLMEGFDALYKNKY